MIAPLASFKRSSRNSGAAIADYTTASLAAALAPCTSAGRCKNGAVAAIIRQRRAVAPRSDAPVVTGWRLGEIAVLATVSKTLVNMGFLVLVAIS
jgi:hypothetical protein